LAEESFTFSRNPLNPYLGYRLNNMYWSFIAPKIKNCRNSQVSFSITYPYSSLWNDYVSQSCDLLKFDNFTKAILHQSKLSPKVLLFILMLMLKLRNVTKKVWRAFAAWLYIWICIRMFFRPHRDSLLMFRYSSAAFLVTQINENRWLKAMPVWEERQKNWMQSRPFQLVSWVG
jgi:hypothetical protein